MREEDSVLLRFRTANVRSLRDEQELSFVAPEDEPGPAARELKLMAFHCTLAGPDLQVRIGSLDRTRGGELVTVAETHPHPTAYFDPDTHTFGGTDLALLKLAHPVTAKPVGLAPRSPAVGAPLRAMGWGYICDEEDCPLPERLREMVLPVADCGVGEHQLLCLRDRDRGASAGHSGGPALTMTARGWRLAGVTSGGGRNVETGERHSVYQDVSAHLTWIRSTVGHLPPITP